MADRRSSAWRGFAGFSIVARSAAGPPPGRMRWHIHAPLPVRCLFWHSPVPGSPHPRAGKRKFPGRSGCSASARGGSLRLRSARLPAPRSCRLSSTVLMRWATTKLVRPAIHSSRASWILVSVSTSTELVLSSRIRMAGCDQQGPGDGDALFLPAGEVDAALLHVGIVALRQAQDELVRLGGLRRGDHLVVAGLRRP